MLHILLIVFLLICIIISFSPFLPFFIHHFFFWSKILRWSV